MKLMARVFGLILLGSFIFLSQVSYAEEGDNVKEVIVEATYQMSDTDTPAKAEEQVLFRAKRNALEQVSSQNFTMENIAALPEEVFAVTVLDKGKSLNGNSLQYWVQIKALVNPEKLEAALKEGNSFWGGPAEYSEDMIFHANGKETGRAKSWTKNNWSRSDDTSGTVINKYERNNKVITIHTWYLRNNKYYEDAPYNMQEEKEVLGTENVGTTPAQKERITANYMYPNGASYKCVLLHWIDPNTKMYIKSQNEVNGVVYTTLYQNVRISPQDSTLFEIPRNYVKCANQMELYADNSMPAYNNNNNNSNASQYDPLQKAVDSALDAAAQRVIDGAVNNILNFGGF